MIATDIKSFCYKGSSKQLLQQWIIALVFSIGFAFILHNIFIDYLDIYHTVMEAACVFIALSLFMSVWFTYRRNSVSSCILGFGYLVVAIFDVLHTIYFLRINLTSSAYFDLSTRFWILGRVAEASILLLCVTLISKKPNKWVFLMITMIGTLTLSYLTVMSHDHLPVLLTDYGVTPLKTVLEYGIIGLFIVSLYKLKDKIHIKDLIEYKYIFISILMSISAELCFTFYGSLNSVTWTIGHVFRITSYYFLYKGTFISTVTYPFEKLETEHKKLEEANIKLKKLSETMNDILDALPIAVQKYSLDGTLKYVNSKFEELMGCNRRELCGLNARQILSIFPRLEKGDRTLQSEVKKRERSTGSLFRTYRTMKGERIKLSVKMQKIGNGILVIANNAKKEQELQNIHLQTQTILNAVSNCILMIDKNKKIILCNRALEEVFDMDRKEIIGMDIDKLNEVLNFEARELPELALTGASEKQYYEAALTTLKGNKKELLIYLASIRDVDGDIIGGISISTDVTDIKKEQQKLIQQEKLAMLGQMGAGIVHETRNYLTTIKGSCQLINMVTNEENTKKYADNISKSVDEVNRIISEFLFLSKPREPEMMEVSLYDVFESVKSMIETSSLVKGVDIDIRLSREERYMLCDESQLKQVILNLCKNAIEAMADTKDAKLVVETGYDELTNEMYIRVTDNGKGISEEDIKKIGNPFFTKKRNGTGLGLSVCYRIVKEHGGRLEVQSKLGSGTTFTLMLPCLKDEDYEGEKLNDVV